MRADGSNVAGCIILDREMADERLGFGVGA